MSAFSLRRACIEAMIDLYGDTSDLDALPAPAFSSAFERKMERLCAHVWKNRYHRLNKTAKVLLVAAILLLLATLSVVAARQFGFTLIDFGDHSVLDVEEHTAKSDGNLTCGYIPEGFTLTETTQNNRMVRLTYLGNNEKYIMIERHSTYGGPFGIDTESRDPREVEHNDITYTIAGSEDVPIVLWMDPITKDLYEIHGNVSEEELLKVAFQTK